VILLCLAFWYSKSQTILLIRKEMSLYWAYGYRQIQTLGDVRLILPRFWWSRNPYLIPRPAKDNKPLCTVVSKNLMMMKRERIWKTLCLPKQSQPYQNRAWIP
jgi:hypothetical protein